MVVCGLTLSLLFMAILLTLQEHKSGNLPALFITSTLICAAFLLLWRRLPFSGFLPQFLFCSAITFLGLYLLFTQSAPTGCLFWFIIFPPMFMFFLGLRHGTAICAFFILLLSSLMLTPLDFLLAVPMAKPERYRFLLAIFGAFGFGWCSEFVRYKTQGALNSTLERLEKEAATDPLTGLGNRRGFQNAFEWLRERKRRGGAPFSLALVDIDRFKEVNDIYGHAMGDRMLGHVACVLGSHIRAADRIFRWGGEEFIILMPETTDDDARQIAERVRRHAENSPFINGDTVISYTISIGLYCDNTPEHSIPEDDAMQLADSNLYAAKKSGRNRVVG